MEDDSLPSPSLSRANKPIAENWCYTQFKVTKFSYMWTINNFSFCRDGDSKIYTSSKFSSKDNNNLKWRLRINPHKITNYNESVSLYLVLVSSNQPEVRAKYKFSIINAEKEETNVTTSDRVCRLRVGEETGISDFIQLNTLQSKADDLLPQDTLTILCEISVVVDKVDISGESIIQFKMPNCKLAEDLGNLFENEKFSDVSLIVGEHEYRAHKAILAARSEVFMAMFEHELEESKSNRVVISDADHKVIKEMLYFIYTGKAPNLSKMAAKLLAAANKYALEKLKVMCEESLAINLTVDKAAETLILADLYGSDQLKAQTIDFINSYTSDVMQTVGWQNMIRTHSYLVADIHHVFATSPVGAQYFPYRIKSSSFVNFMRVKIVQPFSNISFFLLELYLFLFQPPIF